MGYWKTIVIEGKPKFWDKPQIRWQISPQKDQALLDFIGAQADYNQLNADPDTVELLTEQAQALSQAWGDPAWFDMNSWPALTYCDIADLRQSGITVEFATDERLQQAIGLANKTIEAYCNRSFWLKEKTYLLDGSGREILFLIDRPVFKVNLLEIDHCKMLPCEYAVYSEEGYIKIIGYGPGKGIFPKGVQNVHVQGYFGYQMIPEPVKQACVLLAIDALTAIKNPGQSSADAARRLSSARIEDISVSFDYPNSNRKGLTTGNLKVDGLLMPFRFNLEAAAI